MIVGLGIWRYGERARFRALAVVGLWMAATGILAKVGFFFLLGMRPLAILMLGSLGIGIWLGVSSIGTSLARHAPLAGLIGLQSFRLPLELVMHEAAREGTMPPQMTFTGYNFDILTGLSAIVIAYLVARGQPPIWLIKAWNAMGLVLVATVMSIAAASTPAIHAFGTDPAHVNTFVAFFPFVWLPAVLVATAVASHIVIARSLRLR